MNNLLLNERHMEGWGPCKNALCSKNKSQNLVSPLNGGILVILNYRFTKMLLMHGPSISDVIVRLYMIKEIFDLKGRFLFKWGGALTNLFILNCLSAFFRVLRDALVRHGSGFMPSVRPMSGSAISDQ